MASKVLNLKEKYLKEIVPTLQKKLKIKNINAVPKVTKVVLNIGMGKMLDGGKDYSEIVNNLSVICGQKPVIAKAKKSISNFKIRIGMPIGVFATLRGKRMYDFLNELVNVTLPRTRDFRGISPKSFDGNGNYSLAIKEHTVFPEINADDIAKTHGLQITIVTTARSNDEAFELLTAMGFPFQAKSKPSTN